MQYLEFRYAFHARDFKRSVAFYTEILGMTQVDDWDRPEGRGVVLQAAGQGMVEIYGPPSDEVYDGPSPDPAALNLALRVESRQALEARYADLQAQGADLAGPPEDRPWGHRSFIVFDPDSVPVHLYVVL